MQVDHRVSKVGDESTSVGFWVKGSSDGTTGYLVVFRLASQTGTVGNVDMRIFGPGSSATTNIAGTELLASTGFVPSTAVSTGKDYTFRLQIQDVAGGVNFIGSMWDKTAGTQLGSNITYTHTGETALTGAGQVGIRIGNAGQELSAPWITLSSSPSRSHLLRCWASSV
jgi:hypothetical protein